MRWKNYGQVIMITLGFLCIRAASPSTSLFHIQHFFFKKKKHCGKMLPLFFSYCSQFLRGFPPSERSFPASQGCWSGKGQVNEIFVFPHKSCTGRKREKSVFIFPLTHPYGSGDLRNNLSRSSQETGKTDQKFDPP